MTEKSHQQKTIEQYQAMLVVYLSDTSKYTKRDIDRVNRMIELLKSGVDPKEAGMQVSQEFKNK